MCLKPPEMSQRSNRTVKRFGPSALIMMQPPFCPQLSGHVRVSAKCWDTLTAAGTRQPPGPTPVWPVHRICQRSPRQLHCHVTRGEKTTTRVTWSNPTHCRVCTKKFNKLSLTISSWVRRHRPEYRRQMRYRSRSTQTHK